MSSCAKAWSGILGGTLTGLLIVGVLFGCAGKKEVENHNKVNTEAYMFGKYCAMHDLPVTANPYMGTDGYLALAQDFIHGYVAGREALESNNGRGDTP